MIPNPILGRSACGVLPSQKFLPLLTAAFFWLWPLAALQAQEQPLLLFPPSGQERAEEQAESKAPVAPSIRDRAAKPGEEAGIEVDRLEKIPPQGTGIIGPKEGGFDPGIWQDSRLDEVAYLLKGVEGGLSSKTLHSLLQRLLLSHARAPLPPLENRDRSAGPDLLAGRVEALMTLGLPEQVLDLLARVPHSSFGETVLRAKVEALLAAARYDEACRSIRQEILAFHSEPYWGKALIFCQVRDGEVDQAMLGLDLLREGGKEDPFFSMLAFHLAGAKPGKEQVLEAKALHLAVMHLTDFEVPEDFVALAPAYLWPAMAFSAKLEAGLRLELGERAASAAVLTPEQLGALYRRAELAPERLSQAVSDDAALAGPLKRAALFQAIEREPLDLARADLLARLLASARSVGRYRAVLAASLEQIEALQPRSDLAWFAPIAVSALLSEERFELAVMWQEMKQRTGGRAGSEAQDELAAASENELSFLGALFAFDSVIEGDDFASRPGKSLALLAVFEEEAEGVWLQALMKSAPREPEGVDALRLLALESASRSGRLGETLLLAAALLEGRSPGDLGALERESLLSGLAALDLWPEARQLALDIHFADKP